MLDPSMDTGHTYERQCRLVEKTDAGVQAYDGSDPGYVASSQNAFRYHDARASRNIMQQIWRCVSSFIRFVGHEMLSTIVDTSCQTQCHEFLSQHVFTYESRRPVDSLVSNIERVSRRDKERYHFANSTNAQISG